MKVHVITMDEIYIVSSIIDKLPSSWRDVRHTLKHKKEEITLTELAQHLQVEASLRELESSKGDNPNLSTVNMVIDDGKASTSGDKRKKPQYPKGKGKKKVNDNACWECGKTGHRKKNCFVFKNKLKKIKGGASTSNNLPPTKG